MPNGPHPQGDGGWAVGEDRRRPITVVLVDEDSLVRRGLSAALEDEGLQLVGVAGSHAGSGSLVIDLRPDVALIDIGHGADALKVIEQVSALAPATRVLVLSRSEENSVVQAIVAGADGYILKSASPETIVRAVRATAAGEAVLSPTVARKLLDFIRERDTQVTADHQIAAQAIRAVLTDRELEIFTLLASGDHNRKIGTQLGLSANTVSNHIASILAKLHLENRVQAAVQAVRSGIS